MIGLKPWLFHSTQRVNHHHHHHESDNQGLGHEVTTHHQVRNGGLRDFETSSNSKSGLRAQQMPPTTYPVSDLTGNYFDDPRATLTPHRPSSNHPEPHPTTFCPPPTEIANPPSLTSLSIVQPIYSPSALRCKPLYTLYTMRCRPL